MSLQVHFSKSYDHKTICLGVFEDKKFPSSTEEWNKKLNGFLIRSIDNSKFNGNLHQTLTLFTSDGIQLLLVGLGRKTDQNEKQWQKIGSSLVDILHAAPSGEGVVDIHLEDHDAADVLSNMALGALLKSWRFEKYFTTKKPDELFSLKKITFLTPHVDECEKAFNNIKPVTEGVFVTRNVITEPANVITPESLAHVAESLKKDGIIVEILDEKEMKLLGMNALLGVGQGSEKDSKLVIMRWEGASQNEPPLGFIGKGVTFDTGGISIKPAASMEEMKYDMAGAGVVIGLMKTLALRKAKVNAVGVIGLVENMPSGSAQRPGDVVVSMSGQTIEVINTDAEGRLVLADALWYTQDRFKPKLMIDLATLTGAIIVCLGSQRAGLFASDEALGKQLMAAGEKVDELLWPFPLDESYDKEIHSEIADMKNVSNIRTAGAVTAAKFLQRFTNTIPWAHLDIAGVTWTMKDLYTCAKGATGFGVRLLDRFIADNYEGK